MENLLQPRKHFLGKQQQNQTPEQHWKKFEFQKDCEFRNITSGVEIPHFFKDLKSRDKNLEEQENGKISCEPKNTKQIKASTRRRFHTKIRYKKEHAIQQKNRDDRPPQKSKSCQFCGAKKKKPQHMCPRRKRTCKKSGRNHYAKKTNQ